MNGEKGVLASSQAGLFENFDAGEAQLAADAAPFRDRPMPVGGSRKGIPNKRTVAFRELYLKMGLPHPVLALGQMLRLGVDGLAKELRIPPGEAADLYRKIAADISPYVEGKQPTLVGVEGGAKLPILILGEMSAAAGQVASAREEGTLAIDDDVDAAMVAFERNQQVRRASGQASQDAASHADPKAMKDR